MELIRFFIGLIFILFIAYLFSSSRKEINWKLILSGISLQIIFALLISNVGFVENIFKSISEFFVLLIGFSKQGTLFLFPDASFNGFAFSALPVVILFSSISAFLYYFGIFPKLFIIQHQDLYIMKIYLLMKKNYQIMM